MAQLVADSDGKISECFTVPPNIAVGTKLMQFVGSEGNYGEADILVITPYNLQMKLVNTLCWLDEYAGGANHA